MSSLHLSKDNIAGQGHYLYFALGNSIRKGKRQTPRTASSEIWWRSSLEWREGRTTRACPRDVMVLAFSFRSINVHEFLRYLFPLYISFSSPMEATVGITVPKGKPLRIALQEPWYIVGPPQRLYHGCSIDKSAAVRPHGVKIFADIC